MTQFKISDYETIKNALVNRDLKQALYDEGKVIMDGTLLTLHGEEHHKRRKLEHKVFQRDFFKYYEKELFPKTLDETFGPFLKLKRADLIDFGYRITMNLTADFAGIDRLKKTTNETNKLLKLVKKFSEGATLVHSKREKNVVEKEVLEALDIFQKDFLIPSIDRRLKLISAYKNREITKKTLPRDVLTVLLLNEDNIKLNNNIIKKEIAFYLQAGSHSTANSMTHAFHEISNWINEDKKKLSKIKNNPIFLQKCVHESMRLHPASPVAWRKSTCPIKINKNILLEEDDLLIMDLYSANRDINVFGKDANKFNPERLIKSKQNLWGLTFGIGLHMCFGRDLDGGVIPDKKTDPINHQYGVVTLLIKKLFEHNVQNDPDCEPEWDIKTERPNWGKYPIIFGEKE